MFVVKANPESVIMYDLYNVFKNSSIKFVYVLYIKSAQIETTKRWVTDKQKVSKQKLLFSILSSKEMLWNLIHMKILYMR